MAKTPGSRKAKGKRAERAVAALYRSSGLDPSAQAMPMSGAMAFHKGDIFKKNDPEFVDEVKCQEKVKLWEWWVQTTSQITGLEKPVLHITGNFRPTLTVMRLEDWIDMRLELKQLREQVYNKGVDKQPPESENVSTSKEGDMA